MTAKEEREKRLAAQLRANLQRRKAAPSADRPEEGRGDSGTSGRVDDD